MTRLNRNLGRAIWLLALGSFLLGCGVSVTTSDVNKMPEVIGAGGLDTETVIAGLKDALKVGTERAVAQTSEFDGYWGNALIRITMPEELQTVARTLRGFGLSSEVDKFEVAMNPAAETAATEATAVFWDAILQMTVLDAWGILDGPDTAATAYFRQRTAATLRQRYLPIVKAKMADVGVYRVYNELMDAYGALPLVTKPSLDLDAYVTDKALDGLFSVLATEETKIRENPAARTTDLLRRVFG
jgi:hypothetical protein